jgi:formylglycine-generating enzyme required for sulfatase activity
MTRKLLIMIAALVQAIVLFSAAAWAEGKRVALVIGNADYSDVGRLSNPIPDAEAVTKALQDAGFEDVRHLDDLAADAMRRELRDFAAKAAEADVALVYFAGHGVEVADQNYLIPIDAKLLRSTDVEFEAISLSSVRAAVGGAKKLRMVVLDACRNNPFKLASNNGQRAATRGLGNIEPGAGEVVAYSAKEGTIAQDGPKGENSPFASALIKSLAEPGLEIRLLLGRVRDEVLASTKNEQEPYTYASLGGEAIYLKPPEALPEVKSVVSAADEWKFVSASSSLDVLNAFVEKYESDPVFKPLALERLALLERKSVVTTKSFKDCASCPEMVIIPAGEFMMGSPEDEPSREVEEGPQHRVRIVRPFAVSKFEITVGQYREFVQASGYKVLNQCAIRTGEKHIPTRGKTAFDPGFPQDDNHPVTCVSWRDAKAFVYWLSTKTGFQYRLLSESEWEYAARAGSETPYSTGRILDASLVNFNSNGTVPVGQYAANGFGLYDMQGNVLEWTEDCYADSYNDTPTNGAAHQVLGCDRTYRGGGWAHPAKDLRFAERGTNRADFILNTIGIRVARDLTQ